MIYIVPPLGAFKSQLEGINICSILPMLYCHCVYTYIYIYMIYLVPPLGAFKSQLEGTNIIFFQYCQGFTFIVYIYNI